MIFNKPYIPFGTVIERDNFLKKYRLLSQNPRKEKIFYIKVAMCLNLLYAKFWDMKTNMKRVQL